MKVDPVINRGQIYTLSRSFQAERSGRRFAPHQRRWAASGFTMLELLTVILLIGLLALVSPPLFSSGIGAAEHRAAARQVAQTLRYARSEAIARATDVGVAFNLDNKTYQIEGVGSPKSIPEGLDLELITTALETRDEANGSIRFYSDGGSSGGRVNIKYRERLFFVDVNWLTGRIEVEETS